MEGPTLQSLLGNMIKMQTLEKAHSKTDLIREIKQLSPLRKTRRGGNILYRFTAKEAGLLFDEVARLRELTYRVNKGGTHKSRDEDAFDKRDFPYNQVIIWNEKDKEIVGGFRYALGGWGGFATETLYTCSPKYLKEHHTLTMDIGRMFICPKYQAISDSTKGIFSLDNLWDGLGAVLSLHKDIQYLLGRVVSFKTSLAIEQLICDFFAISFPIESQSLLFPKEVYCPKVKNQNLFKLGQSKHNYKVLLQEVRQKGGVITPLIFAYMNVTSHLYYMGSSFDKKLNVIESCIMVNVKDIYPQFIKRHFT